MAVQPSAVDAAYPNAGRPPVRIMRSTPRPLTSDTNPSPTPPSSSPSQRDRKVMYQDTAVQTLPPGNAVEFERVFGFPPADGISGNIPLGIKVKGWTGLGAMGRFQKRTGIKYDLIYGEEYQAPAPSTKNVEDREFQTVDFQTRTMATAKAKAKAVIQAKNLQPWMEKQDMIARPETRGYMIVHSEQFQVKVKVDQDGTVDGSIKVPFPNVVCKEQNAPAICLPEHDSPSSHHPKHEDSSSSHHRSYDVEDSESTQASPPSALVNTMKDQADADVQAHDSKNSPKANVESSPPQEKEGTQPEALPQPLLRSTSQTMATPKPAASSPQVINTSEPRLKMKRLPPKEEPTLTVIDPRKNGKISADKSHPPEKFTSAPSPNPKKRDRDDFPKDQVDWSDGELAQAPKKQRKGRHEEAEFNIRDAVQSQNAGSIIRQAPVESQGSTQFQNVDRIEQEASRKCQDEPNKISQRSARRAAFRPQGVWKPPARR
ncbi:hypothetical protein K505DRAFT_337162 [Melanomma pulvis-pyrius CBS 109.77]|uniref:Uncharacterized protein n=1 Tax=Melanomma pulvis-pyrius CBS 109.77 TaxID=1314802 RepID=A0A6A6XDQ6_9PLEO|nr:hypothetical protein K505DRAFT_337162 [Melanomma pulvis-pyrius CBS 109.77]